MSGRYWLASWLYSQSFDFFDRRRSHLITGKAIKKDTRWLVDRKRTRVLSQKYFEPSARGLGLRHKQLLSTERWSRPPDNVWWVYLTSCCCPRVDLREAMWRAGHEWKLWRNDLLLLPSHSHSFALSFALKTRDNTPLLQLLLCESSPKKNRQQSKNPSQW